MENPISKAADLLNSLKIVLEQKTDLGNVPKGVIQLSIDQVKEIYSQLTDIHQNFVSLDFENEEDKLNKNLEFWESLEPGLLKNIKKLGLYEKSKTLNTLYGKGINILNIHKFDASELELSQKLASSFFADYHIIDNVKRSFKDGYFYTIASSYNTAKALLNEFERYQIISGYEIERHDPKTDSFQFIQNDKCKSLIDKIPPFAKFRFKLNFASKQYRSLIEGHWFNAYTYYIIYEHLKRNQFDFEIYARVSYEAPMDIFLDRGDLDIIAMVGNRILLAECKSGNFRHGKNEIEKLINKTAGLRKVFDVTKKKYSYNFLFIYNPNAQIENEIIEELNNNNILPITINDIRKQIGEILR